MQQDVFKSLLPLTNCLLSLLMLADKLSILSFVHICSFVNQKSEIKKMMSSWLLIPLYMQVLIKITTPNWHNTNHVFIPT